MSNQVRALVWLSLRAPRAAAREVLSLGWSTQALWLGLSIVSLVSSIVLISLLRAMPMTIEQRIFMMQTMPGLGAPLVFALLRWLQSVLAMWVFFGAGAMLGSRGTLRDVLAVMTWLHAVSFVLLTVLAVLGYVLPFVSSVAMMGFVIWWLWATVVFLDEAHGFENGVKAFAVLAVGLVGVVMGMSVILTVIGPVIRGLLGGA